MKNEKGEAIMKILLFETAKEEQTKISGADEIAIAMGADGIPRIAAHCNKSVFYMGPEKKPVLVASASIKGAQYQPVVDCYGVCVASSPAEDAVTCRNRTKGMASDKLHGPVLTIVKNGKAGPAVFNGFTTGGVRCLYEENGILELWSKDGAYGISPIYNGLVGYHGRDSIGKTGEKLAVWPGGWRAFGGCSTFDNSRVMRRGEKPVDVVNCDIYKGAGCDLAGYVGICAKQNTCYFAAEMKTGTIRANRVSNGVAHFSPSSLPILGPASTLTRHATQLVPVRGRVAAFWTYKGNIMGVDFDGAIEKVVKPVVICSGDKAAAVKLKSGIVLAVLRKSVVHLVYLSVAKI